MSGIKNITRLDATRTVLYRMGVASSCAVTARSACSERYGVHVKTHPPSIPYRETITRSAEGHCRHKKQTGGAGQFGEVTLRVEALERGRGFEFVDEVVGGAIPGQYIPAVEKGVRQVLTEGALAGFPLQDLRVIVLDGKHHPVDSKEVAFVSAGRKALLDAGFTGGPNRSRAHCARGNQRQPRPAPSVTSRVIWPRSGRESTATMLCPIGARRSVRWYRLPRCQSINRGSRPSPVVKVPTRWN